MFEFARKILNRLPNSLSLFLFRVAIYITHHEDIRKNKQLLIKAEKEGRTQGLDSCFLRNINELCVFGSHIGADLFIDSYFWRRGLKAISLKSTKYEHDEEVTLICCVKNDLERIKKVISYHRSIGINKMVFVDNLSNDGTREYLMNEDVDLYSIDEEYHAGRKASWIRQVQDIYGYDKWYLIVDSDELFTYVGLEEHSISDLVKYARNKGIVRIRSMLLDMYPAHNLYSFSDSMVDYDFLKENRFFDANTYFEAKDGRGFMVRGGPRMRCFEGKGDNSEPLTKYPLSYTSAGDIWCDHRPIPFSKNFNSEFISVLRHYKFLPGDYKKYQEISMNGNYYNNSANYKKYTSNGCNISFYCKESKEFSGSESLNEIGVLEKIDWSTIS